MTETGGHSLTRGWVTDGLIALLVFLIVFAAGYGHLHSLRNGRSAVTGYEYVYGPAVMLANGHGFASPDLVAYPKLRAFLRGETEALPPDAVPDVFVETPLQLASYHRYLIYTVAFFWRVLGISWTSLEPLLALLLAWSGIAVYGIMRLGMKRPLALVATLLFMVSPAMLGILTELRDFGKAPFMLSMLMGLGWLIKHRTGFKQLLFAGISLGLVAGIGMGFRQDVFVFLPVSLVVLGASAFRTDVSPRWPRLVSPLLCIFCFYITAWPMLGRMEGATNPDHNLVQGFSNKRLDNLGILSASYRPMASGSDCYVFSALQDHMRRAEGEGAGRFTRNTPGSDRAGRHWTIEMARRFPADVAARGCAAVLRALRYADAYPPVFMEPTSWHERLYGAHRALAEHLHRFGLFYGLAALAVIAACQPVMAVCLFLFCLYVFGYIAVQCEYRHAFHLAFLPFWILGFLADRALTTVKTLRRRGLSALTGRRRAVFFAMVVPTACVLVLIPPLTALRWYQARQALPLLEAGISADRVRLPVSAEISSHGWTLFSVADRSRVVPESDVKALCRVLAVVFSPELRPWHARGRLLVAEFKADAGVEWLIHKYDSALPLNDFSQLIRLPATAPRGGVIRYYFPVYELLLPLHEARFMLGRNHFRGIALPDDKVEAFLGLYEVEVPVEMTLLMQFATTGDRLPEKVHQRIGFLPDPVFYYQSEKNATDNLNLAEAARRFGTLEQARFFSRAQLVLSRKAETRLAIASSLFGDGALEYALDAALDVRDEQGVVKKGLANLLEMIGRQFQIRREPEAAEQAFAAAWDFAPDRESILRFELAGLYADAGRKEEAVSNYRSSLLLKPEDKAAASNADVLLSEQATGEERSAFWLAITYRYPNSLQPWLRLGGALEAMGDVAGAKGAYEKAFANHPEDPEAAIRHAAAHAENLAPEGLRETLNKALKQEPALKSAAVACLDRAAREMQQRGRFQEARAAYALAASYDPENEWLRLRQAEAAAAAGDTNEARTHFEPLLTGSLGREAANGLNLLCREAGKERLDFWQDLDRRIPGNEHVRFFLNEAGRDEAMALFEAGDYPAVLAALEAVCPEPCSDPGKAALLFVAKLLHTGNPDLEEDLLKTLQGQDVLKPQVASWLMSAVEPLITAGRVDRAETAARAATRVAPSDEGVWLALVKAREGRQDLEAALNACREGLAASVTMENLARVFDDLYLLLNRPEERLREWQVLREKHPGNGVVLLHLGAAFDANSMWSEAVLIYARLAEMQPDSADVHLRLGNAQIRGGKLDEGLTSMKTGMALDGATPSVLVQTMQNASDALLGAGRFPEAESLFREVLRRDPQAAFSWLRLGDAQYQQKNTAGAIETWKHVLNMAPESSIAAQAARLIHHALSPEIRVEFWRDMADEALAPSPVQAWYAISLIGEGEVLEADRIVTSLLQSHCGMEEGNVAAGLLDCLRGEVETGLERIRNAAGKRQELAGDAAEILSEIALKMLGKGDAVRAVSLLRASRTLAPGNLLYAMHLGEALLKQGSLVEAIEEFMAVLKAVPESPKTAGLLDEAFRQKQDPEGRVRAWQEIAETHPEAILPRQRLETRSPHRQEESENL